MRKIPEEILNAYLADDFSRQCCFCGNDKPQIHHNLVFAGRQINEVWCLLPLCKTCHDSVNKREYRQLADWAMLNRASDAELQKYSTVMDYRRRRAWLHRFFGFYSPENLRTQYEKLVSHNQAGVGE